jgi:hypothetical protein
MTSLMLTERGESMFSVFITCPTTGSKVPTGIRVEHSDWNSKPQFQGHIRCPLCGIDHQWSVEDVRLSEEMERSRLAALRTDQTE